MHGLDFLLVLNSEGFCEVMLDGNTPRPDKLSPDIGDKLFAVASDLEVVHLDFLLLFKIFLPEVLKALVLHHLVVPPADLASLLWILDVDVAEFTLLCFRIQNTTPAARWKILVRIKFDWIISSEFTSWSLKFRAHSACPICTTNLCQT